MRPSSPVAAPAASLADLGARRGRRAHDAWRARLRTLCRRRCSTAVRRNATLNAFITLEPARVLEQARARDARAPRRRQSRGRCSVCPFRSRTASTRATTRPPAGTPALRTFRPQADAPVVAALKAAGALVLGKTNLHELSYGWTSNNLAFGAVRNPYDHARIPGGSSGGTAAAIAARLAPLGYRRGHGGLDSRTCGVLRHRRVPADDGTLLDSRRACRSPRCSIRWGRTRAAVADLVLFDSVVTRETPLAPAASSARRAPRCRARVLVRRSRSRSGAHHARALCAGSRSAGAVLVEAPLARVSARWSIAQRIKFRTTTCASPSPATSQLTERLWTCNSSSSKRARTSRAVFRELRPAGRRELRHRGRVRGGARSLRPRAQARLSGLLRAPPAGCDGISRNACGGAPHR